MSPEPHAALASIESVILAGGFREANLLTLVEGINVCDEFSPNGHLSLISNERVVAPRVVSGRRKAVVCILRPNMRVTTGQEVR